MEEARVREQGDIGSQHQGGFNEQAKPAVIYGVVAKDVGLS